MSRDITPFGLRMPTELKTQIEESATASGRSINAEIVGRLRASLDQSGSTLADIPDGLLLDEVITRYGAKLQLTIDKDIAERVGLRKRAK
jgi:hypothetical protein